VLTVSKLRRYAFCPLLLYLDETLHLEPEPSYEQWYGRVGHCIRYELSLRNHKVLREVKDPKISLSGLNTLFLIELENIKQEVPFIYKDELLALTDVEIMLEQAAKEISLELEGLARRARSVIRETCLLGDELAGALTPWKAEFPIRSKKLGLSGRLDKIEKRDGRLIPVEIKTGRPAPYVWDSDKLQLAAYAMLLEERFDVSVPYGFVEYTRINEKRPVIIDGKSRRDLLALKKEVEEFLESGEKPMVERNKNKCRKCGFKGVCSAD